MEDTSPLWPGRINREVSTGSSVVNLDLEDDDIQVESLLLVDESSSSHLLTKRVTPPLIVQGVVQNDIVDSPLRFERSREFSNASKTSDIFSSDSDSPPLSPRAHVEFTLQESERIGLGHRRVQALYDSGDTTLDTNDTLVTPFHTLKENPIIQLKNSTTSHTIKQSLSLSSSGSLSSTTSSSSFLPFVTLNRIVLLIVSFSFLITAISQFQYVSRIASSSSSSSTSIQDSSYLAQSFIKGSSKIDKQEIAILDVIKDDTTRLDGITPATIPLPSKAPINSLPQTKILPAPFPRPSLVPHQIRELKILSAVDEMSTSNVVRRNPSTGLAHTDKDAIHHLLPVTGGVNAVPPADGLPSFIPTPVPQVCSTSGSWDSRLITLDSERDLPSVLGRVNWHRGCINRREKLSIKTPLSKNQPETNPFINYYYLKRIAFKIYHLSSLHFPEKEWSQAWTPFFPGPWVEDYFEHTFAHQRIRKNITLAEYYFEIEVLRPEDITLIEGCGATSDPIHFLNTKLPPLYDLDTELLVQLHKEYKDCANGRVLSAKECRQVVRPAYIDEYKEKGAQWVLVEYPFDFDLFYPWIPLFFPLDRIATMFANERIPGRPHVGPNGEYQVKYRSLMENLNTICDGMFEDFQFITVTKRAYGFEGIVDTPPEDYLGRRLQLSTIVLNAGGLGDVIIPLLADKHSLLSKNDIVAYNPTGDFDKVDISFLGKIREEGTLRYEALESMRNFRPKISQITTYYPPSIDQARQIEKRLKWPSWVEDSRKSNLQLAPSGVNPTSFRLFETLMLGLVPVFLHSKEREWNRSNIDKAGFAADFKPPLPYHDFSDGESLQLWDRISILVSLPEFQQELLPILTSLVRNSSWLVGMHENVRAARDSYFTHDAVMQHIYRFFRDPWTSELYCYN
jgi:hypothetical protein